MADSSDQSLPTPSPRVADTDREVAVTRLQEAVADGRLDLSELVRNPVKVATHSGGKLPLSPPSKSLVNKYQSGSFESIVMAQNCGNI